MTYAGMMQGNGRGFPLGRPRAGDVDARTLCNAPANRYAGSHRSRFAQIPPRGNPLSRSEH